MNPVDKTVSGSLRNSKRGLKCHLILNCDEEWLLFHQILSWEMPVLSTIEGLKGGVRNLPPGNLFQIQSFFFLIDVQLVYNIASVSGVQHSNSVLLQMIFHYGLPWWC